MPLSIRESDFHEIFRRDAPISATKRSGSRGILGRGTAHRGSLLATWIAPADPAAQNLPARLQGPSRAHWMGTDELGRDTLSRTLYGARVSLLVAVSVVCGCGFTGLILGMLAGYAGGWVDRFVNLLLVNAFLSFPGILLAIAFAAFLGPGIGKVILALVITGWAGYARLARAQVLKVKELEFILAARSLGASHLRILVKHLLPNILQPVLDPGDHRNGRRNSGGVDAEFSWTWRAGPGSELGCHAERRAEPLL